MSQSGVYDTSTILADIETLTGNVGGATGPDIAGNVDFTGTNPLTVTGTPGTNSLAITVAAATTTQAGVLETSTDAESIAGTSTTVAVTPASLTAKLGTQTDHGLLVGSGTAAAVTALGVATNGQLPIGSVGADPVLATLTAGTGVTITNAAGSITIDAGGVDQSNILYVGKHGNDANDGLTIEKAKLTFQNAINAAAQNTVIWCFDDGAYTENLTGSFWVSIYAPNARIDGYHTLLGNCNWYIRNVSVPTGTVGFTMNDVGNHSLVSLQTFHLTDTAVGFANLAGTLDVDISSICFLANGYIVDNTSVASISANIERVEVSGTGTLFSCAAGSSVSARLTEVVNTGVGNGQLFYTTGVGVPVMAATATSVILERLSDITAGSIVKLNASDLFGSLAEAGAGNVSMGGASRIDNVPIGDVTPSNATFTTLIANTSLQVTALGLGVMQTDATGLASSSTGTDGQILIANTAGTAPVWANIASAGGTVDITNGAGTINLEISGGIEWSVLAADLDPMVVNTGYICNKAGLLTVTLPATAAVGTIQRVTGINTNLGWHIAQRASQQIHFGSVSTTAGVGGSIASTLKRDSIELVCVVADTEWNVCPLSEILPLLRNNYGSNYGETKCYR